MQRAALDLVRRGQRGGWLRADLPATLLAQAMASTLRVALPFARTLGADPDRIGDQIADLLQHRFLTPPASGGDGAALHQIARNWAIAAVFGVDDSEGNRHDAGIG